MNQFKRAKAVLVPTNKEPVDGNLLIRHLWKNDPKLECNTLWEYKDTVVIDRVKQYLTKQGSFRDCYTSFVPADIYIITEEHLLPNEYGLDIRTNTVIQNGHKDNNIPLIDWQYIKRIIATTNKKLFINSGKYNAQEGYILEAIPKVSDGFINKYIKLYNKKEILVDILVEYTNERLNNPNYPYKSNKEFIDINTVKVDDKNTITIKRLQTTFNRMEVIDLIRQAVDDSGGSFIGLNNWIDEHL